MAEREPSAGEQGDYIPNTELFYRDVIHEDNWTGYAALGFERLPGLSHAAWHKAGVQIIKGLFSEYGIYNIYTGHVWNNTTERPASDGPGVGLYVSPAGLEHKADFPRQHIADFLGQSEAYEHEIQIEPDEFLQKLLKRNQEAIHTDNWPEYAARGFTPVADQEHLDLVWLLGISNFYTGEPWDEAAGRPSHDRSTNGTCVYTSPKGLWHWAEMQRKDRENQRQIRQLDGQANDDPASRN